MMESLRRRYKVTLEEQDKITERIEKIFRGMFALKVKENVADLVEDTLNRRNVMKGDTIHFEYGHSFSYEGLVGILGEIRNEKLPIKNNKKTKKRG